MAGTTVVEEKLTISWKLVKGFEGGSYSQHTERAQSELSQKNEAFGSNSTPAPRQGLVNVRKPLTLSEQKEAPFSFGETWVY